MLFISLQCRLSFSDAGKQTDSPGSFLYSERRGSAKRNGRPAFHGTGGGRTGGAGVPVQSGVGS